MAKRVSYWSNTTYRILVPDECPTNDYIVMMEWLADNLLNKAIDMQQLIEKEETTDYDIADVEYTKDKLPYNLFNKEGNNDKDFRPTTF